MRCRFLCHLPLALLLAACAGGVDREGVIREARTIYAQTLPATRDTFQGIKIYGPLPAGFETLNRNDEEVGCAYYARDETAGFDRSTVCVDDHDRVLMVSLYKEFTDKYALNEFFLRTREALDDKYGRRVVTGQSQERFVWEFKNEEEWTDAYVKHWEDASRHDPYSRIYHKPETSEIHDKLKMIALEKQFNLSMPEKRIIEIRDYVVITYTSRLADMKRSFKTKTGEQELRKTLEGL